MSDKNFESFKVAVSLAQKEFPIGGTILEFGVAGGTSFIHTAQQILKGWPCKLIGFDSWKGLPKETEGIQTIFHEGMYSSPRSEVEKQLLGIGVTSQDKRFELIDGWFKDSLTEELQRSIKNLIFVNVDVDLYKSAVIVLDFIKPFLQKNTLIYFDDWGVTSEEGGEQLAVKQWSKANPEIDYELSFIGGFSQLMKIKNIQINDGDV